MTTFSEQELEFLVSQGFKQDPEKHAGYFFLEEGSVTYILVNHRDSSWKMEFHESYFEDGKWKLDFSKTYSVDDESLQHFVERCF